jgi:predicted AlkP superfamily pyrophosphatase or phosphodiesterase
VKRFAYILPALLAATPLSAHADSVASPKIIVLISVDQFSADLFAEYRPLFSGGLKRLQGGAVFPSGYQSHAATETCPGHSTLLTGSRPARTGIIANEWLDLSVERPDKRVYCAEDPTVPGSSSANYSVSAHFLKARTLGDRLKTVDPQSRVVSVAGKDRAAVMMGGHSIDQAWYFAGSSFVTLPSAAGAAPKIIETTNIAVAAQIARPPAAPLPAACQNRSAPVAVAGHVVGVLHEAGAGDAAAFKTSPAFDRAITDVAVGLMREMKLGSRPAVDVLAIGLSATDYVGHMFGTEGAEMCAQLMGVDDNVARILQALDATHVPYVVVLTADHGGHDLPERNQLHGMQDAARVDPDLSPGKVGQKLAAEFGLEQPVLFGLAPFGDVYLARSVPEALRARVMESARAKYLAYPQVAAVFTSAELARVPMPAGSPDEWSLAQRFRASFDPRRSGDLLVALKPHVTPIADARGAVATHGSPWNYDRRVPILFYRPGVSGYEQPLPIETVDIMPTLAALIGLTIPAGEIDGHCIDLDPGPRDTCKP